MLNHITIMGRLTRDPEMRRTGNGIAVASFTIACDRDRGMKDQEKETDFIDCVAWRQTGEFVSKYFTKGRMIIVSGRLEMRRWTDKEGNKRVSPEVVADSVYFGDSRKEDTDEKSNTSPMQASSSYAAPPAPDYGRDSAYVVPPAPDYGRDSAYVVPPAPDYGGGNAYAVPPTNGLPGAQTAVVPSAPAEDIAPNNSVGMPAPQGGFPDIDQSFGAY